MAALLHVFCGGTICSFPGPESPDLLCQSLSFHIVDWQEPQRIGEQSVAGPFLNQEEALGHPLLFPDHYWEDSTLGSQASWVFIGYLEAPPETRGHHLQRGHFAVRETEAPYPT